MSQRPRCLVAPSSQHSPYLVLCIPRVPVVLDPSLGMVVTLLQHPLSPILTAFTLMVGSLHSQLSRLCSVFKGAINDCLFQIMASIATEPSPGAHTLIQTFASSVLYILSLLLEKLGIMPFFGQSAPAGVGFLAEGPLPLLHTPVFQAHLPMICLP